MSTQVFRFKTEEDPIAWIRPGSYLFVAAGLGLLFAKLLFAIPCLIVGGVLMFGMKSTHVILDVENRIVKTKSGFSVDEIQFQESQNITLNNKKVSQNVHSRVSSTTVRHTLYQAYLMVDDGYVLIAENRNYDELIKQLTPAAKALEIPIEE